MSIQLRCTTFVLATALVLCSRVLRGVSSTDVALHMTHAADLHTSFRPTYRAQRSDRHIPSVDATMYVPNARARKYQPSGAYVYDVRTDATRPTAPQHQSPRLARPFYTFEMYGGDEYDSGDSRNDYSGGSDTMASQADDETGDILMLPRYPDNSRRAHFVPAPVISMQTRPAPQRSLGFSGNLQSAPFPYNMQPQYDEYDFNGYRSVLQKRYQPQRDYFVHTGPFQYHRRAPDHVSVYATGYTRPFDRYLVQPEHSQPAFRASDVFVVPSDKQYRPPHAVVPEDSRSSEDSVDDTDFVSESSEEDILFKIDEPTMNASDRADEDDAPGVIAERGDNDVDDREEGQQENMLQDDDEEVSASETKQIIAEPGAADDDSSDGVSM